MEYKTIATTRFNKKTFQENKKYNSLIKSCKCIYGTPIKIKTNIPLDSHIYVLEMNNDRNKIEGIGYIVNRNIVDKNYRIYEDMDYNRYIYKGKKYLSIENIDDKFNKYLIEILEKLVFKGKQHCKRAQGITELAHSILYNEFNFNFVECFDKMFKKYT
jgi:hypothetical protein